LGELIDVYNISWAIKAPPNTLQILRLTDLCRLSSYCSINGSNSEWRQFEPSPIGLNSSGAIVLSEQAFTDGVYITDNHYMGEFDNCARQRGKDREYKGSSASNEGDDIRVKNTKP